MQRPLSAISHGRDMSFLCFTCQPVEVSSSAHCVQSLMVVIYPSLARKDFPQPCQPVKALSSAHRLQSLMVVIYPSLVLPVSV